MTDATRRSEGPDRVGWIRPGGGGARRRNGASWRRATARGIRPRRLRSATVFTPVCCSSGGVGMASRRTRAVRGSSPVGGEILRQAPGRLERRRMHAARANDTSVSEFCTEQGIWASIKPLTLHLYVNPEGQLRAQGCARSSWAADGRRSRLSALRRHKSQFGMQIRSSGDRTDRQIAYRRISPPTGLDPFLAQTARTARTCIYGHLEEHHANYPAVSRLQVDDNVPGREHALGRPRHARSALAL